MKTRKATSENLRTALVLVLVLVCTQAFSVEERVSREEQLSADTNLIVSYLTAGVNYGSNTTDFAQSKLDLNLYSSGAYNDAGEYELMDEEIAIEEWMLTPKHSFWKDAILAENEDEIALEEWMLDASVW